MHKGFQIKNLSRISILGTGLLGGSIGHALRAAGFEGTRVGIGRRNSTLKKAVACEAVDETTRDIKAGVANADLTILCTPIGSFENLLPEIRDGLHPGAYVTDVASTKAEVVRLARKILPKSAHFVGSHPMAGSEKTGVEYARADLFENALCLVTPTKQTSEHAVQWIRGFWETIGGHTLVMSPRQHDNLLAWVSHLPHAVATALVNLALQNSAIELAGPGFADSTRIASGDPNMWTDIFLSNQKATLQAVDRLIKELTRFRNRLQREDAKALQKWLADGKKARDDWLSKQYKNKALFP